MSSGHSAMMRFKPPAMTRTLFMPLLLFSANPTCHPTHCGAVRVEKVSTC